MKQFQLLWTNLTIELPAQKTIWFFFGWLVRENFIRCPWIKLEFLLRIWGINIPDWTVTLCEGPELLRCNISDNLLCREYWKLMAHSTWPLFRTCSGRHKVLQFLRIGEQLNVLKCTKCWMLLPQECKLELAHYPNCQHVGRGQAENK